MSEAPASRAILVLGPPSGGGRAVADLLVALGGRCVDRGLLVSLNEALLDQAGGSWRHVEPAALDAAIASPSERIVGRARELLDATPAPAPLVLEDPRLCLTLPFWLGRLPESVVLIVAPSARTAAIAMRREHGLPVTAGLASWELHLRRALTSSSASRRILVPYADLARSPRLAGDALRDRLAEYGAQLDDPDPSLLEGLERARDHPDSTDLPITVAQQALEAALLDDPSLSFEVSPPSSAALEPLRMLDDLDASRRSAAPDERALDALSAELGRTRARLFASELRARALLEEVEALADRHSGESAAAFESRLRLARAERELEHLAGESAEASRLRREVIARGGVIPGRDVEERLTLARTIVRAFRKRLFRQLTAEHGVPYSGVDRQRAPKVMIGTLSSGENEHAQCLASVEGQTHRRRKHEVFENLGKAEAVATLMESFQSSDCELMVKVDADMVLVAPDFVARVVEVFQANPSIDMLQMAILDYFSGAPMQGINAYRKTFGWRTERQDRLFTDKTGVPSSRRLVVWSTFLRDVIHSPNPSPFQAFHFGVHRGMKVLQPDAAEYGVARAEEQLAYLEQTWAHFALRRDRRLALACLGFELALGGEFDLAHLDYTNPHLKEEFARYSELDTDQVAALVEELRGRPVGSARVEEVRARRGTILESVEAPIRSVLMLIPHTHVYGGINRFFELSRQLERLGVRCVVARPEPEVGETLVPRDDFPDVEVRCYGDVIGEVWDVVLCGDALSGVLLTAPLFSARLLAAYLLNGWIHAPANEAQIKAVEPDVVVANSSYAAAQLKGMAPTVVPGGVNLEHFFPRPTEAARQASDTFDVCVYPGRRKPRKRFGDAVEACRILQRRGVPVVLHAYDQEPIELDEPFDFVFHGALDKPELRSLLWDVDVMLCPEEDAGWSNPAAEAMACGTPLVCTDAGTTDFAIDGETALVVPTRSPHAIADALERLHREPALADSLRARGLERIRAFGWPQVARTLLDALSCARLDLAARSARNARALRRIEALGALEPV